MRIVAQTAQWFVALYSILALDGCGVSVQIQGTATAGLPPLAGSRVAVSAIEQGTTPYLAKAFTRALLRALELRGAIPVFHAEEAKYLVRFSYGVDQGGPKIAGTPSKQFDQETRKEEISEAYVVGTQYTKHLFLQVHSPIGSSKPAWTGQSRIVGPTSEIREEIDFLVAAAVRHLGETLRQPHEETYHWWTRDPIASLTPGRD